MTTNLKPLLTRKHVAAFVDMECDCTDPRCKFEESACRTIERMAGLLEQWLQVNQVSSHAVVKATHDLLKTFNATGGEGS